MKWQIYTRGEIPLYRLEFAILSIQGYSEKICGVNIDIIYGAENNKIWWGWNKEQINALGKKILEITKTKEDRNNHLKKMEDFFEKAINSSEKIRKTNLEKLDNNELIEYFNKHFDETKEAHALMDVDIDAIDLVPVEYLKEKLKKEIKIDDFNEVYRIITSPTYTSFVKESEIELLKITDKIKKNNLSFEDVKGDIKKIADKYWWISLGWESKKIKSEKDFLDELKDYLKNIENPEEEIKKIKELPKKAKEETDNMINKYNFNEEVKNLIELFDMYHYLLDLRKEMQMRTLYSAYLLLREAGKRINIDENDLEWFWYDEICELLKGEKIDIENIKKRKSALFILGTKKGITTFSGKEASEKIKTELDTDVERTSEIKGISASPGVVVAKVKVCNGIKQALKKIEEGDILVCGMTLPDYVPVMKKASAIITDEGGITCHAAIVSRELKIPCIIGTKIATKVLKDNDLVEVDANKGIIKKIK